MSTLAFSSAPIETAAAIPPCRTNAEIAVPRCCPPRSSNLSPQMHRIRTVRLQQGVSLRSAARQTGTDIRQLRLQEQETTDLRLSDLHKWQKALDVPMNELLEEPNEPLSRPVMERARMVRIMKTVNAIREHASALSIQRMAQMLAEQLTEVMPELKDVSPWHTYGQRRSLDEYGRAAERRMADDSLGSFDSDEAA